MAVKAPITESALLPHRPRLSPHPSLLCSAALLITSHSNDIRLAGTCENSQILQNARVNQPHACLCVHIRVFIPVAYCSDRQHSDVCTRAKHSFCSLPGTCRCYLGNGNKQSEVPGLVTTCSLNKLERWLKASLDFGLLDKFKAKSCEKNLWQSQMICVCKCT